MRRNYQRGPIYTPGFNMADIEFFDDPPEKRHRGTSHRGKGSAKRHRAKKNERKLPFLRAKNLVKQLATVVAQDLLEIRAMNFEENEIKFREQQRKEARDYAERLSAAFRAAVKKEAAGKS